MSFSKEEERALKNILTVNLDVKEGEKLFILAFDPETLPPSIKDKAVDLLEMSEKLTELGEPLCDITLVVAPGTKIHGEEPGKEIWEKVIPNTFNALVDAGLWENVEKKNISSEIEEKIFNIAKESGDVVNAVVALTYYSTSHTLFRRVLTNVIGARYASMPLFERYMLLGSMNVNYSKIRDLSLKIKEKLSGAKKVEITAPNGTHISLSVEGREFIADTGLLHNEGDFGNLPAGEVFVAPVEGSANGKLVIDYGPEEGKLSSSVIVYIENGNAVRVEGRGRIKDLLESKFEEDERCRNVAELGIGTNPGATHVENILEAEKILGTIHIAFGDNSSFGGKVKAPFHQDFVVFKPTVRVSGREQFYLHRDGNLLV